MSSEEFIEPFPIDPDHEARFVNSEHATIEFEEVLKNPTGEENQNMNIKKGLRNFRWLYLISALVFVGLLARSGQLQLVQAERYRGLAEGNRLRGIVLQAPRGILYDRNGQQLVQNIPYYELVMTPMDVPADSTEREQLFKDAARDFDMPLSEIKEAYEAADPRSIDPLVLRDDIERELALILETDSASYAGISAQVRAVRSYERPQAFAHLFGYVGKLTAEEYEQNQDYELNDNIGKAGLEQSYERTLRGQHGVQNVEVNAIGEVESILAVEQPTSGSDLMLTIDAGVQQKLYESLKSAADRGGKKRAAAVAIDPRNGEVIAMVSVPGFDVNEFSQGIDSSVLQTLFEDENQPLFNRPVDGTYPPGSTFKPFVATGALQEGVITESTNFLDTGIINVGGTAFTGWKPGGHGNVNVISAIANSVNGFFYSIGGGYGDIDGIGISGINEIASSFGFGEPTGVDLPSESKGLLPTPEWKELNYEQEWFLGDTYNASIGQGFVLATPLQLAVATAAVANGGTRYVPHIGKTIIHPDGVHEDIQATVAVEQVANAESIEIVRRGMRATVAGGTGRLLNDLSVKAAGKTGTAQFGSDDTHAWFTAFAPYDEPTIAITVLVEEAGEGSDFSAPVALDVLRFFFRDGDRDENGERT